MKKIFENLILLLVVFILGCEGFTVTGQVGIKDDSTKPTEGLVEQVPDDGGIVELPPEELSGNIRLAVEKYGAVFFFDNTPCQDMHPDSVQKACVGSNDSYQRILGYSDFSPEMGLVFVPDDNWEAFLEETNFPIKNIAGYCSASENYEIAEVGDGVDKDYVRGAMFMVDYGNAPLSVLNHERAHCSLGSGTEVISMWLGFHLTLDQAILDNNVNFASQLFSIYAGVSNSVNHDLARIALKTFLNEWGQNHNSYSELFANYLETINSWGAQSWLDEIEPRVDQGAGMEGVYDFMSEFVQENLSLYPECTQEQKDSNTCVSDSIIKKSGFSPVEQLTTYYPELPDRSFRIDYQGSISNPMANNVSVVDGSAGDYTWDQNLRSFPNDWFSTSIFISDPVGNMSAYVNVSDQAKTTYALNTGSVNGQFKIVNSYHLNGNDYEDIIEIEASNICSSYITPEGRNINRPGILLRIDSTSTTKTVQLLPCQ